MSFAKMHQYGRATRVGGISSCDNIPYATLMTAGEEYICTVYDPSTLTHYMYFFDPTSSASEDSPDYNVIEPDDKTGDGRWLLAYSSDQIESKQDLITTSNPLSRTVIAAWGIPTARSNTTTPIVANGGFYSLTSTGADYTVTDFISAAGGHTGFTDGMEFLLKLADSHYTIDMSSNPNIEAPQDLDYTASDTQVTHLKYVFGDSRWNLVGWNLSRSPGVIAIKSLQVPSYAHFTGADALYDDNAGSQTDLITSELKNTILTNGGAGEAKVYQLPAATYGENFMMLVNDTYAMDLKPDTGEQLWLNGVQMAANEPIVNDTTTKGEMLSCISYEVSDGVYERHCHSKFPGWAQETPP